MFGYKYNYSMHPTKNVITLAPTKGTYAKAFLPWLVISAVGYGALFAAERNERKTNANQDPTED